MIGQLPAWTLSPRTLHLLGFAGLEQRVPVLCVGRNQDVVRPPQDGVQRLLVQTGPVRSVGPPAERGAAGGGALMTGELLKTDLDLLCYS